MSFYGFTHKLYLIHVHLFTSFLSLKTHSWLVPRDNEELIAELYVSKTNNDGIVSRDFCRLKSRSRCFFFLSFFIQNISVNRFFCFHDFIFPALLSNNSNATFLSEKNQNVHRQMSSFFNNGFYFYHSFGYLSKKKIIFENECKTAKVPPSLCAWY